MISNVTCHRAGHDLIQPRKASEASKIDGVTALLGDSIRPCAVRTPRISRTEACDLSGGIWTGINWDGRRSVLAVEIASRESQTSWKDFLEKLRDRGLRPDPR